LTVKALGLADFSVVDAPASRLGLLEELQSRLTALRTKSGVSAHTLELTIRGKQYYMLNLRDAESRIRDLNMVEALVELSGDLLLYETSSGMILRSAEGNE
jgi:flagellin-like hook-associated protein FlgL